jgi:phospholipase/carboxylesterase
MQRGGNVGSTHGDAAERLSRRRFVLSATSGVAALTGCLNMDEPLVATDARLRSRPGTPNQTVATGLQALHLDVNRDGLLYVPSSYRPDHPLPLVVLLHGATGSAAGWFGSYGQRAEANNVIFLAVDSRGTTWDAIRGTFSVDPEFIDRALAWTFQRCAIDAARVGIGGFSDGASYGLSLGLANGDLFRALIGYSPGFVLEVERVGSPSVFLSHGTSDSILPIESTSRSIVPLLRQRGYAVEFVEFAGGHEVPPAISARAIEWFLAL